MLFAIRAFNLITKCNVLSVWGAARMDIKLLIIVAIFTECFSMEDAQIGAAYLQDTIKDLQMMTKGVQKPKINKSLAALSIRAQFPQQELEIPTTTEEILEEDPSSMIQMAEDKVDKVDKVPALQLTKAELAALYESALKKGETIKLDVDDGLAHPITAAVHEIGADGSLKKGPKNSDAGYYYYYYPLKSFLHELTSAVGHGQPHKPTGHSNKQENKMPYYNPYYHGHHSHYQIDKEPYLHSHTHQHNVHIETTKATMAEDDSKKKGLEPLFMAISGFIGMTVMFILSVLVLPKFKKLKPKEFQNDPDFLGIGRVALQAIEGYDCAERFACEAGKAVNAFHLYDNRFVKFLRRFGPMTLGKQIDKIGKYTQKRYKCGVIQCKKKENYRLKSRKQC